MKLKRVFCAALCAALLAVPALAADADGDASSGPDMCAGLPLAPGPEGGARAAFIPLTQDTLQPVMVYGRAAELEEGRIRLQNDNTSDPYSDIILNVGEDTVILDAVTGESRTFEDIKENETLYAYAGPIMTRSLPPISNAVLILCSFPADFGAPIYAEVQQVIPGEDGKVSVLMTGDIVLHLSEDTELLSYLNENAVSLADIVPGTRLLSWYTMVMESFPGQAVPSKVMVFPYGYSGYVDISGPEEITLDGEKLDVTPISVGEGTLMLPVRAFAEALGCEVAWDAADPDRVTVTKDGAPLYSFRAGEGTVTVEGDMVMDLTVPALAQNKTAYLPAQDLLRFHGLKLVGNWPV